MQKFSDEQNRAWRVDITVATLERVKKDCDLDILALIRDPEAYKAFAGNPVKLVEVLYVICEEEIKDRKLEPEAFGKLFKGDVISRASDAFVEALIDFLPTEAERSALRQAMTIDETLKAHGLKSAAKKIGGDEQLAKFKDKIDQEIDRMVNDMLDGIGEPSMSSPGSAESTPAP